MKTTTKQQLVALDVNAAVLLLLIGPAAIHANTGIITAGTFLLCVLTLVFQIVALLRRA